MSAIEQDARDDAARLTDAEHNDNGELAGRINWDRTVFTEDAVVRIVADRVREAVERERERIAQAIEARARAAERLARAATNSVAHAASDEHAWAFKTAARIARTQDPS